MYSPEASRLALTVHSCAVELQSPIPTILNRACNTSAGPRQCSNYVALMKRNGKIVYLTRNLAAISVSLVMLNCSNSPKMYFSPGNDGDSHFVISANDPRVLHPSKFLRRGKSIDKQTPSLGWFERVRYNKALNKYPTVKECLKDSAEQYGNIDLKQFDWKKIRGEIQTKVCLFRIFDAIGDQIEVTRWLETQGFTVSEYDKFEHWPSKRVVTVRSHMSGDIFSNSPALRKGFSIQRKLAYSAAVGADYDLSGKLREIYIGFTFW